MDNRDSGLFSKKAVGVFAAIALAALYATFPGKHLLDDLQSKPIDVASMAYLRAAFNREPGNAKLRIQLVEKLFEIGNLQEAEQLFAPLMITPHPELEVRQLSIKIKFRRFFELQDELQKQNIRKQLNIEILEIMPLLTEIEYLNDLATLAEELGEPLIAAKIYQRIIEIHPEQQVQRERNDVWAWLGIDSAFAASTQNIQFYIHKQLQALLAADSGAEALKWADYYVQQYPEDPYILEMAIEIAQSQNAIVQARDWGRQLTKKQRHIVSQINNILPEFE